MFLQGDPGGRSLPEGVALAPSSLVRVPRPPRRSRGLRDSNPSTRGGEGRSMKYSEAFKEKMVEKMAGVNGRSANSLSEEVGVHQSTLSRWLDQAGTLRNMSKKGTTRKRGNGRPPKRPQDWAAQDKLEVVLEAVSLAEDDLGAFLRRKGLHQAQLDEWRTQLTEAALEVFSKRRRSRKASPEAKRIRELEKELRRKDKALAETAALLVLKKKVDAIWGDVDDDTDPRNGR